MSAEGITIDHSSPVLHAHRDELCWWLTRCGLGPDLTSSVTIMADGTIEATVYLTDEHGKRYVADDGKSAATTTLTHESPPPLPRCAQVWLDAQIAYANQTDPRCVR